MDVPLARATVELWTQALAALGPAADHTEIAGGSRTATE